MFKMDISIYKVNFNNQYDNITKSFHQFSFKYVNTKDFKIPLWYEPKNKEKYAEKVEKIYSFFPTIRSYYETNKDLIKPEIGLHLYLLTFANNYKEVLNIGNNDISNYFITEAFARNPQQQLSITLYNEDNTLEKEIIDKNTLSNYYLSVKDEIFLGLDNFERRKYKFDLVFINYISNFDELMVILHYVNLLTPVGSCIVINNIDTPSINKFINYIENNYQHWKLITDTFVSKTCVTFVKVNNDSRQWNYHVKF